MAVDTNFVSLFDKLKVEDPWLPPRTWESIPSQSGPIIPPSASHNCQLLGDTSSVSEARLVRLALNALQGVQPSLISIEKLSAAFLSDPTDRTFHRIPSLWNRSSSTHALGKILKSIGYSGSLVFLLCKFVDHFRSLNLDEKSTRNGQQDPKLSGRNNDFDDVVLEEKQLQCSLINQAFAVAVGKVLEGYICALDTLYASIGLRRSLKAVDVGCLTSVVHSEITLLEVYLHTKELRTQIEALGNICNLHKLALRFFDSPLKDLTTKATLEFFNFYRGGDLLTYLYTQLQVADPGHCSLLKFLFLRSCDPYFGFIRSWIFKAEISDPYKEFIVEYVENLPPNSNGKAGTFVDFALANIRERDGASVPCFLKQFMIPLVRAGQQLQVLIKLLELCNFAFPGGDNYSDFLPSWTGFSSNHRYSASPMTFSRQDVDALVIARDSYYEKMEEKLDNLLTKLKLSYQQAVPCSNIPFLFGIGRSLETSVSFEVDDSEIVPTVDEERSSNIDITDKDFEDSSLNDEFSYTEDTSESSECSALSGFEEQTESREDVSYHSAATDSFKAPVERTSGEDQTGKGGGPSNLSTGQEWKLNFDCNIFSRNPMLDKFGFSGTSKLGVKSLEHKLMLPFFDFSSVEDPRKIYVEKLAGVSTQKLSENPIQPELSENPILSVVIDKRDDLSEQGSCVDHIPIHNAEESHVHTPLKLKEHDKDISTNVFGTSSWGSLLCRLNENNDDNLGYHSWGFSDIFEIPLDFIIEKCLLQEILLQYNYVSRLTIKVLDEGFELQEHFMALRRYYFMELADWADLFIMSLWHHKWCATEAELRVPEIQGFLELSVQRSSCERDPYKDRLFVYLKGPGTLSLSTSTYGVHSFNFLGLGYRVDWPVSLVLTPHALEIYAKIFSFLIQLKLAIFSLNDAWCSMKGLAQFIYQNSPSTHHQKEAGHYHLLMKLRHQVNHFVSTLQQYVQSQLSHVSWCKFQHSLKHKVKDMMDLELVHMAYLTDSLDICFLSDETQFVASIMENILQCALDFRSTLTRGIYEFVANQGDMQRNLSRINVSQVLAIKQKFNENLKKLHLCYLKAPKHGEFGLCRFWEYLNYNEYYSDIGNNELLLSMDWIPLGKEFIGMSSGNKI